MRVRSISAVLGVGACLLALLSMAPAQAGGSLKLYADEIDAGVRGRINYGYDRDAVCPRGLCADNSTPCVDNAPCAGIGDGTCHYTTCVADFNLCEDDTTICANNADCTGIGGGTCVGNPCAPPNEVCGVKVDSLIPGSPTEQTIWLRCSKTYKRTG